jgi:hypothetical protein
MAALRAANPALAGMDPATGEEACYIGCLKVVTFGCVPKALGADFMTVWKSCDRKLHCEVRSLEVLCRKVAACRHAEGTANCLVVPGWCFNDDHGSAVHTHAHLRCFPAAAQLVMRQQMLLQQQLLMAQQQAAVLQAQQVMSKAKSAGGVSTASCYACCVSVGFKLGLACVRQLLPACRTTVSNMLHGLHSMIDTC